MSISILVYTHSEYSFLWKAMIPLLKKFVKDITIHWLYNDNADLNHIEPTIPNHWIKHTYNESVIWTERVGNALKNINDNYILFLHEDWLPIDNITIDILNDMILFMYKNDISFLLSYSHISTTSTNPGIFSGYDKYYFYRENAHVFQPAIWNKLVLQEFCKMKKTKHQNEDYECLNFMRTKTTASIQNIDTVLSIRTKNSLFYPHFHAMSEGLWNFTKYPELKPFLQNFDIDTDSRGIHTWWELDTK